MTITNPRLAMLAETFAANRGGLDYLDALAAQEKRAFTADERTAYDRAIEENDAIALELPGAIARTASYDAVAAVTADIGVPETGRTSVHGNGTTRNRMVTFDEKRAGQPVRGSVSVEDLGEFALALGRAKVGRLSIEEANETLGRYDVNVTEELGRVVAHGVAADGTAPVTIEGDLIKFVDANRYAVNASRVLPMPDNKAPTFKRPRISQFTTVAQQVTEGDVLSSQRLQATGDTVTKTTRGGVLSLSEQEIDWTDPAMLGLAIQDLAQQYAITTDTVLTAAIEAAVTEGTETTLSLTATAALFIAGLASSAAVVYGTAKRMADRLYVAPDRWAYLAGLTDTTGRPLFPITGPLNGAGVNDNGLASFTGFNVMGLELVVDPNFSSNVMITGVSSLVEFYEQNKGLLQINVPSTLEVQYAYRGYVAANVYSQGLNGIEVS